jgi:hypothetical protein
MSGRQTESRLLFQGLMASLFLLFDSRTPAGGSAFHKIWVGMRALQGMNATISQAFSSQGLESGASSCSLSGRNPSRPDRISSARGFPYADFFTAATNLPGTGAGTPTVMVFRALLKPAPGQEQKNSCRRALR